MHIKLRLMGTLKDKTPADETLELDQATTIADVLDRLEIPRDSVQVFTVNGSLVRDQAHRLSDGDDLTVLPPVGGG